MLKAYFLICFTFIVGCVTQEWDVLTQTGNEDWYPKNLYLGKYLRPYMFNCRCNHLCDAVGPNHDLGVRNAWGISIHENYVEDPDDVGVCFILSRKRKTPCSHEGSPYGDGNDLLIASEQKEIVFSRLVGQFTPPVVYVKIHNGYIPKFLKFSKTRMEHPYNLTAVWTEYVYDYRTNELMVPTNCSIPLSRVWKLQDYATEGDMKKYSANRMKKIGFRSFKRMVYCKTTDGKTGVGLRTTMCAVPFKIDDKEGGLPAVVIDDYCKHMGYHGQLRVYNVEDEFKSILLTNVYEINNIALSKYKVHFNNGTTKGGLYTPIQHGNYRYPYINYDHMRVVYGNANDRFNAFVCQGISDVENDVEMNADNFGNAEVSPPIYIVKMMDVKSFLSSKHFNSTRIADLKKNITGFISHTFNEDIVKAAINFTNMLLNQAFNGEINTIRIDTVQNQMTIASTIVNGTNETATVATTDASPMDDDYTTTTDLMDAFRERGGATFKTSRLSPFQKLALKTFVVHQMKLTPKAKRIETNYWRQLKTNVAETKTPLEKYYQSDYYKRVVNNPKYHKTTDDDKTVHTDDIIDTNNDKVYYIAYAISGIVLTVIISALSYCAYTKYRTIKDGYSGVVRWTR